MILRYDGDEVLDFAHKLSNMHRSALPNAVRFTLNDAAFDVKKRTLQIETQSSFINRRPGFFKRFSTVDKATGWNIGGMISQVGIIDDPGVQATSDLATQETGGELDRSMIMLSGARTGQKSLSGKSGPSAEMRRTVRSQYKAVGGFKDHTAVKKKDFVKGAFAAEGKKKPDHLRYMSPSGKGYMIEVTKITKLKSSLKIKSKIIASYEDDRKLHIKPNPFLRRSSLQSASKLNQLFKKNAIRQIRKYL